MTPAPCVCCGKEGGRRARGLCAGCYSRLRQHGGLDRYPVRPHHPRPQGECAKCSQTGRIAGRRLCETCYYLARRDGWIDDYATGYPDRDAVMEDAEWLHRAGEIPERIAARVGAKIDTIEGYFRAAGRKAPWVGSEAMSA